MEEPLRQIVTNAGDEPSVVVNTVAQGEGNFGYNAQPAKYGDMVEMGVLDPTKVTDRKSTRLYSSHRLESRMPSSA